jgi:hypothetical protein
VSLHGKIATGKAGSPYKLDKEAGIEASTSHERRLHGQHLNLQGRSGVELEEDRCSVAP